MPPVVIDVRNAEDPRDVVHRAVQALSEGKIVAFPTETVYGFGARALDPDAVETTLGSEGKSQQQSAGLGDPGGSGIARLCPRCEPIERAARPSLLAWSGHFGGGCCQ